MACWYVVVTVDSLPPRLGKKADARRRMVAASRKLAGLVPTSVQLAFARQGAKEQGRAMMIGTGRVTATARADIGARC